jgi:membrane associated rhomboid family serine protease
VWFVLQLVDGFASLGLTDDAAGGIAFFAHIGGFVAGMLLALPLRFMRPDRVDALDATPAAGPAAATPAVAPGPPPPPARP